MLERLERPLPIGWEEQRSFSPVPRHCGHHRLDARRSAACAPSGTSEADAFAAVVHAGGEPDSGRLRSPSRRVAPAAPVASSVALRDEGALAAFGELSLVPVLDGCGGSVRRQAPVRLPPVTLSRSH